MIKPLSFTDHRQAGASADDIAAFEKRFKLRLPPAFVEFCTKWNGGFPSEQNAFYPVPFAFGRFHQQYGPNSAGVSVDGLFGLTEDLPQCSVVREFNLLQETSAISLMPIAFDLLGNHVVLRTDSGDNPVYWRDHELWDGPERSYLIPIALDLEAFYNALTMDPAANA